MPTRSPTAAASWPAFVAQLEREILPLYAEMERRFDPISLHGRMHVCRAVVFAELMLRFYVECYGVPVDVEVVRAATAFHDAGRQGSGVDEWERASAELCTAALERRGMEPARALWAGDLVVKRQHAPWSIERQIVTDADVLEIMRPLCCGGIDGFRRERLGFASGREQLPRPVARDEDLREQLVQQAWELICVTDGARTSHLESPEVMRSILDTIARDAQRWSLLAQVAMDHTGRP